MAVDIETYKQKAQHAIESVFRSEYHNSLGIPMPEVTMLLPDDDNYITGQYYILINETWQIHLNFGKLPISFKEFEDEVKVLTRHEIEHYMCCPFDVITHLRMLKTIIDVYKKEFSHLGIDIQHICGSIANQAADIIVDTKNYQRNPQETLTSEINWIKKGADIRFCPRHCKLMFLTKEALWGKSLEINETDTELLKVVKHLAEVFSMNGVDDKHLFLGKTEEYARAFFKLFEKDIRNPQNQSQQGSQPQQGAQSQNSQSQQGEQLQQTDQLQNGQSQQGGLPQHEAGLPKDGNENGSAFVFSDPDKVKEAITALAEETEVQEFSDILSAAGIKGMTESEKQKLWFTIQGANMIPIEDYANSGNKETYTFPSIWHIGDPIGELDLMLSMMTSPKVLPGVTTKKWEQSTRDSHGTEKKHRDLLLVLDTSGSMKSVLNKSDNMHQAVLAAFGIISYLESVNSKVALIEFSDTVGKKVNWTRNYDEIRESLLVNGQGGTSFPLYQIKNIIEESNSELVTVLITDGDLSNIQESCNFFRDYLSEGNKFHLFLLGNSRFSDSFNRLKDIGAKVYHGITADDFCNEVLSELT